MVQCKISSYKFLILYTVISSIFHLFAFYADIRKLLNFVLRVCSVLLFLIYFSMQFHNLIPVNDTQCCFFVVHTYVCL